MAENGFKRLRLASSVITVPVCLEEKLKEGGRAISITRAEKYGRYTFEIYTCLGYHL